MYESPTDRGDFRDLNIPDAGQLLAAQGPRPRPAPAAPRARVPRLVKVYTLEIRHDSFEYKRYPRPFAVGLYDGESFHYTWGPDCIDTMMFYLAQLPRGLIYAHQGGRLHFYFMQRWIQAQKMLIIDHRIVRTFAPSADPRPHELRDSWAIIPADLRRPPMDQAWFEPAARSHHKAKILDHLKADCEYQHGLVKTFREMFGDRITVGAAAMHEFQQCHHFERLDQFGDTEIRDDYYYGGRTQYFEHRIVKPAAGRTFKMYDVNSMYPWVMKSFQHPISGPDVLGHTIRPDTMFLKVEGRQTGRYAAFASRSSEGPLDWNLEEGVFYVSIHEFRAAEELGIFKVQRVIDCWSFFATASFDAFVDKFAAQRGRYLKAGDLVRADLTKLIHSSAYGKLAQDWRKFKESVLVSAEVDLTSHGWKPSMQAAELSRKAGEQFWIWERTPRDANGNPLVGRFFNVATAASITGAARAVQLRGLYAADRPIYCDTDSILCEELRGVRLDQRKLGAWKLEGECTEAAIANLKTYALFGEKCWKCGGSRDERRPRRYGPCDHLFHGTGCMKLAAKGVRVDPQTIVRACLGSSVRYENPRPVMRPGSDAAMFRTYTVKADD